jgi:hypothetical protein
MSIVVAAVLTLFAVAIFLLIGAVIELFRGLEQVRKETGSYDSPVSLEMDLPKRLPPASGLPEDLLRRGRGLLLVLSDKCSTCGAIADHLGGTVPASTWLLFAPQSRESGTEWLTRFGLNAEPRILLDDGRLAKLVGVNITPAVLRIRDGNVVAAHTLPSGRRLDDELDWLAKDAEVLS